MKINEREKISEYLDPARKLKMLLNMKISVIIIEAKTLAKVPKNLQKRLGELEIRGSRDYVYLLKSAS